MQSMTSRTQLGRASGSCLAQVSGRTATKRNLRLVVVDAVKKRSGRNIVKVATLVSAPKKADKVRKLCKEAVDHAHSEMEGGRQSGIEVFECQEDSHEEGTFHFWERYASNGHMATYNSSKQMQEFQEKVRPLLDGPIGMVLYEYKNGQLGAVSCPVGPLGEGGLEDAPGGNEGSGGGAGLKQTSSTLDLGNLTRGDEGDSFGMAPASKAVEEAMNSAREMFQGLLGKAAK